MSETWAEHEARIVEQLAKRYQLQGYVVEQSLVLPDGTRADLLARRADETVLVEIKRVNARDSSPRDLARLAELAERSGWKFTIVLVRDAASFDEVEVLDRASVVRLIDDASHLDRSSWIAALAAAAAFEAAARHVLARVGAVSRPSPLAQLQALASRGLVTPEEEGVLRELIDARNVAAHGMTATAAPADVVAKSLAIAAALLAIHPLQ